VRIQAGLRGFRARGLAKAALFASSLRLKAQRSAALRSRHLLPSPVLSLCLATLPSVHAAPDVSAPSSAHRPQHGVPVALVGCADGTVRLLLLPDLVPLGLLPRPPSGAESAAVTALAVSEHGSRVVAARRDGSITVSRTFSSCSSSGGKAVGASRSAAAGRPPE
jgi:hypothetical protein